MVEKLYDYLNSINDNNKNIILIYMIFSVIVFFLFVYYLVYKLDTKSPDHNLFLTIFNITFMMLIIPGLYYNLSLYEEEYSSKIEIWNCSDYKTNNKLLEIREKIEFTIFYDSILLLQLLTNFIIPLLLYYTLYKGKLSF